MILFTQLSLKNKIFMLPAISIFGFLLYLIFNIYNNIENEKKLSKINNLDYPVIEIINKNWITLLSIEETFIDTITVEDDYLLQQAYDDSIKIKKSFASIIKLNSKHYSDIKIIEENFDNYFSISINLVKLIIAHDTDGAKIQSKSKEMRDIYANLTKLLSNFKTNTEISFKNRLIQAKENSSNASKTGIIIGSTLAFILLSLSLIIIKIISTPIKKITNYAEEISQGNWTIKLEESKFDGYEFNKLTTAFIHMQKKISLTHSDLTNSKNIAIKSSQAKSEFLSNMSHELKTPLNGILGLSELMSKTQLNDMQKKYLDSILTCSKKLLSDVNDILEISNLNNKSLILDKKPFNLNEVINETHQSLKHLVNNDIEFIINIPPKNLSNFIGDPLNIQQIIYNLLNNAIKFTKQGCIQLSINYQPTSNDNVIIAFEFNDSGIGIPSDKLKALFDDFSQSDNSITREHEGLGLGLAIVKKLIELMNGNMSVKSTYGEGSTFYLDITLPVFSGELPNNNDIEQNISLDAREYYTDNIQLPNTEQALIDTHVFNETKKLLDDTFQTFINAFYNNMEDALAGLQNYTTDTDINELIRCPHNIKSTCSNLGAIPLAKTADECETHFHNGDIAEGLALLTKLKSQYQDTIKALEELGYKKNNI